MWHRLQYRINGVGVALSLLAVAAVVALGLWAQSARQPDRLESQLTALPAVPDPQTASSTTVVELDPAAVESRSIDAVLVVDGAPSTDTNADTTSTTSTTTTTTTKAGTDATSTTSTTSIATTSSSTTTAQATISTTTTTRPTTTTAAPTTPSTVTTTTRPTTTATTQPTTTTTTTTTTEPPVTETAVKLRRELVDELNRRRVAEGLNPVQFDQAMSNSAADCAEKSLRQGRLEHCGYEVLWSGPASWTAAQMLDAWWASPGHYRALTWETSTRAGGAMVYWTDGRGTATAAIEIDY